MADSRFSWPARAAAVPVPRRRGRRLAIGILTLAVTAAVTAGTAPVDEASAAEGPAGDSHVTSPVQGRDYTVERTEDGERLTIPTDLSEVSTLPPLAPSDPAPAAESPGLAAAEEAPGASVEAGQPPMARRSAAPEPEPEQRTAAREPEQRTAAREPQRRTARVLNNGAWSIYMNPRVLQTGKATYVGSVSNQGSVQATRLATAHNRLDHVYLGKVPSVDDHVSPTFTQMPSGRIAAFWSGHGDMPVRYKVSRSADAIDFGPTRSLTGSGIEKEDATYTVILQMAGEAKRYWLFTRIRGKRPDLRRNWWLTTSNDLVRWTRAVQITKNPYSKDVTRGWPYLRMVGDGNRTIDIAITDGDPANLHVNSQFHIRYTKGRFVRSDGSLIRTMADLAGGKDGPEPLDPREGTLIHNGSGPEGRARVYDIARGPGGQLALAMTTQSPEAGTQSLKWFRLTKGRWDGSTIQRREGTHAATHGYDLVHGAPNRAYLVSIRHGERGSQLQEWWTDDQGLSWSYRPVAGAQGTTYRTPVAPWSTRSPDRGSATTTNPVFWSVGRYETFRTFNTRVEMETTGAAPVWVRTAVARTGPKARRVSVKVHQGVYGPGVPAASVRLTWKFPRTGVAKKYAGRSRTVTARANKYGVYVSTAYQPPGTRLSIYVPRANGYGVGASTLTIR